MPSFYSIDISKVTDCNHITSQPLVYVDDVEKFFFIDVESDTNWKYVFQSHARKYYMMFDNMDAPILDDGRHVTGLLAGENPPHVISVFMVYQFYYSTYWHLACSSRSWAYDFCRKNW